MKSGTQAALALGVGYVLGRRRKMRMTTVLAAAAATGGLGGLGGAALRRGMKALGSTEALSKVAPQLGGLADTVRGDLLDAGKAAAAAAVSSRIESLTDSLHERAELVRDPGAAVTGAGAAARAGAGEATRRVRRRSQEAAGDDAGEPGDEEEFDAGEPDEPEAGEPEVAPTRRRTSRAANGGPSRSGTTTGRRSPVTRARR